MHGLMGQARHYDILVKQMRRPALMVVCRIERADLKFFVTSLALFGFRLSDFLGGEFDVGASVAVVDDAFHLGLLAAPQLVNTEEVVAGPHP